MKLEQRKKQWPNPDRHTFWVMFLCLFFFASIVVVWLALF